MSFSDDKTGAKQAQVERLSAREGIVGASAELSYAARLGCGTVHMDGQAEESGQQYTFECNPPCADGNEHTSGPASIMHF